MAGEKTEQPTQKKLRDAQKKGQVAKSQDLTQAILFLTSAAVLQNAGGWMADTLRSVMTQSYGPGVLNGHLNTSDLLQKTGDWWRLGLMIQLPLLGSLFVAAAASGYLQVRGVFSLESLKPSFEKLNPLEGAKKIFAKPRTYIELLKNLLKLAIIAALAYNAIRGMMHDIALAGRIDTQGLGQLAAGSMFKLLYQTGGAFLVIGAADFLIQRHLHMKELMMTKEEVKREHKDQEGDPHVKHQRKHIHQQILNEAELGNVKSATAVVVNPVHIAVALRYDETSMTAPRVTARGQDLKAKEIRDLARRYQIPTLQNIPLAHQLYAVEPGHDIPEELYEPVAEVLLWVHQLNKQEKEGKR